MRYRNIFPELYSPADTLQVLGGAGQKALDRDFSILIWNIYKGQKRGWDEDFRALTRDRNIVLLQESILNTPFDPIFQSAERFEWVMARSHGNIKTRRTTGVKTGCCVASTAQSFYLSPDAEPIVKTPKMLLATSYAVSGTDKLLLVINIHAINFVSYAKYSRQMDQIIAAIENHDGPVILAGDFNTWNSLRYKSLQEMTRRMGLEEIALERKRRIHHLNQHLDHVFYRGLKPVKAEVLLNVRSSDHYPITVDFSVVL